MRGEISIKIAADHNLRNQITKVQKSIGAKYQEHVLENRQEQIKIVRESSDYCSDMLWESDGKQNPTSAGGLCIDGAGCIRIYNNQHRGRQSAAVVNSNKKTVGSANKKGPQKLPMCSICISLSVTEPMDVKCLRIPNNEQHN